MHWHPTFRLVLLFIGLPFYGMAQEAWSILDRPGKLIQADAMRTDAEGWTHFYKQENQQLILSIQTAGQHIGELGNRLKISTGLLANYGQGANDLSGADYVEEALWLTMNRYWRIEHAASIFQPVRIRLYFDTQDLQDIRRGLTAANRQIRGPGDLLFYTLEGKAMHPFAFHLKNSPAELIYHGESDLKTGQLRDFYYAELTVKDLNCSGSGGFLLPLEGKRFSVSGTIKTPQGIPLENIFLQSPTAEAAVRTTLEGQYTLANLPGGTPLQLKPYSQEAASEQVTVLDLLALRSIIAGERTPQSFFQEMAADVDGSGTIDTQDLNILREVILNERSTFPGERSWHFFPERTEPAALDLQNRAASNRIQLQNLAGDVENLDFIGVKIGNLQDSADLVEYPPPLIDPHFYLDEYTSCGGGEPIPFELRASDFHQVQGFQFTLSWDPNVIGFDSIRNVHLPNWTDKAIGRSELEEGKLTIAWFAPQPVQVPDDSTLLIIWMRAIGGKEAHSSLSFTSSPTPIEVIREKGVRANAYFTTGQIHIDNASPIELVSIHARPVSCFGATDGAIRLRLQGGKGPFEFHWSNGATTKDISGLKAGNYALTIFDSNACPFFSSPIEVAEPPIIHLTDERLREVTCPGVQDGAISFTPKGGKPPYSFLWSNGAATPWIGKIGSGAYTVTITDAEGCQREETFNLADPQNALLNYALSPPEQGKQTGQIKVWEVLEAQPPFEYLWSTEEKKPNITDLKAGLYALRITDAAGCKFTYDFELQAQARPAYFSVQLRSHHPIVSDTIIPLYIQSPDSERVQLKIFDSRSRLVLEEKIDLLPGHNLHHFRSPSREGTYFLQLISSKHGINSERLTIKSQP